MEQQVYELDREKGLNREKEYLEPIPITPATSDSDVSLKSILVLLSLCPKSSRIRLGLILLLNIAAGLVPLIFYIESANAIQEMENNYHNPDGYYEATLNICIILFATGLGFIIISSLATFLLLIFSRAQGEL